LRFILKIRAQPGADPQLENFGSGYFKRPEELKMDYKCIACNKKTI
jgi:hypothetical protein